MTSSPALTVADILTHDVCDDDDDSGGDWIPRRRARGDAREERWDGDDDDDAGAWSVRVHIHSGCGTESGEDCGKECVMRDDDERKTMNRLRV